MLTQCPSCRARARLGRDHDGAKVRCAECGRVFVARAAEHEPSPRAAREALIARSLLGLLFLIALAFLIHAAHAALSGPGQPGPTESRVDD